MVWAPSNTEVLIGKLPTRIGARLYESRPLNSIRTLVLHYLGDPIKTGSIRGYGTVAAYSTAHYQTTKKDGDLFPEIAYHFQVDSDGTVYQLHALSKRTWHAGKAANDEGVAILLTGFGMLGQPTPQQIDAIKRLRRQIERHLDRELGVAGHCEYMDTICPTKTYGKWIAKARERESCFDPEDFRSDLDLLYAYISWLVDMKKAANITDSQRLSLDEITKVYSERVLAIKGKLGL